MEITHLTHQVAIGPQIAAEDLATLAREGFTDVVCNRPDSEHPDDPGAAEMELLAADVGLTFHYLPIAHGEPFPSQAAELAKVAARPGAKVFAYCRSGARSTNAWTLGQTMRTDAGHHAS